MKSKVLQKLDFPNGEDSDEPEPLDFKGKPIHFGNFADPYFYDSKLREGPFTENISFDEQKMIETLYTKTKEQIDQELQQERAEHVAIQAAQQAKYGRMDPKTLPFQIRQYLTNHGVTLNKVDNEGLMFAGMQLGDINNDFWIKQEDRYKLQLANDKQMKEVSDYEAKGIKLHTKKQNINLLRKNDEYMAKVHSRIGMVMKKARQVQAQKIFDEIQNQQNNYTIETIWAKKERPKSIIDESIERATTYIQRPIRDYSLVERSKTMTLSPALPSKDPQPIPFNQSVFASAIDHAESKHKGRYVTAKQRRKATHERIANFVEAFNSNDFYSDINVVDQLPYLKDKHQNRQSDYNSSSISDYNNNQLDQSQMFVQGSEYRNSNYSSGIKTQLMNSMSNDFKEAKHNARVRSNIALNHSDIKVPTQIINECDIEEHNKSMPNLQLKEDSFIKEPSILITSMNKKNSSIIQKNKSPLRSSAILTQAQSMESIQKANSSTQSEQILPSLEQSIQNPLNSQKTSKQDLGAKLKYRYLENSHQFSKDQFFMKNIGSKIPTKASFRLQKFERQSSKKQFKNLDHMLIAEKSVSKLMPAMPLRRLPAGINITNLSSNSRTTSKVNLQNTNRLEKSIYTPDKSKEDSVFCESPVFSKKQKQEPSNIFKSGSTNQFSTINDPIQGQEQKYTTQQQFKDENGNVDDYQASSSVRNANQTYLNDKERIKITTDQSETQNSYRMSTLQISTKGIGIGGRIIKPEEQTPELKHQTPLETEKHATLELKVESSDHNGNEQSQEERERDREGQGEAQEIKSKDTTFQGSNSIRKIQKNQQTNSTKKLTADQKVESADLNSSKSLQRKSLLSKLSNQDSMKSLHNKSHKMLIELGDGSDVEVDFKGDFQLKTVKEPPVTDRQKNTDANQ